MGEQSDEDPIVQEGLLVEAPGPLYLWEAGGTDVG